MSRGLQKTRFGDLVDAPFGTGTVTGCEGLILTIIEQARQDFLFSKVVWIQNSAAQYFRGELYRNQLVLLDLPEEWLPAGITSGRLIYQLEKYILKPGELMRYLFGFEIRAIKKKLCRKYDSYTREEIIDHIDDYVCRIDRPG